VFFLLLLLTVFTVELAEHCSDTTYFPHWDFLTLTEAQDFYQKFWTTELSTQDQGWCSVKHTLLLGVKGKCGDLQTYSSGAAPQVFCEKDWVVPEPCTCGECSFFSAHLD